MFGGVCHITASRRSAFAPRRARSREDRCSQLMPAAGSLAAAKSDAHTSRFFHFFKPNASIPSIPWHESWAHTGAIAQRAHHSHLKFAHCVVGQPRSIVAPEVRSALRRHLFEPLPGVQHVFVHFSTLFVKGAERNHGSTSPSDEALLTVARELGALSVNITHDLRSGLSDCHASKLSLNTTDKEYATLYSIVAWANVKHCFANQVAPYEREQQLSFDFVTRIRPDAVHFAPVVLPPLSVMHHHVVLPFRGIDGGGLLPNDHMAIAPRTQASQYFEKIADQFNDCTETGRSFHDGWHLKFVNPHDPGSTRIRLVEASAAFRLQHMGQAFVEIPWPYGLSARMCCCNPKCAAAQPLAPNTTCAPWYGREMGTEAGHTGKKATPIGCLANHLVPHSCSADCPVSDIESMTSACVLPLQCSRLSTAFNNFAFTGLPKNSTLPATLDRNLLLCANVTHWPELMQGPCSTVDPLPFIDPRQHKQ